jgi:hypothetical protein
MGVLASLLWEVSQKVTKTRQAVKRHLDMNQKQRE